MYDKFEEEILKLLYGFIKPTHIQFVDQWVDSLQKWERINYENSSLWIERLILCLEAENPHMDRYYVLLAGLIYDIDKNLENKLSVIKKATPQSEKDLNAKIDLLLPNNKKMRDYLKRILKARNLVRGITKAINNDQKSAIMFLRNKYSHPVLSDYKIKLTKPDEEVKFEFDMKKYLSSGKNLQVNEIELFDQTKTKLLAKSTELAELKELLWEMRNT